MKSTGIVRSLDSVGRVVLPMEIRKEFELFGEDSRVEIFLNEDQIVLNKYKPNCIFRGSEKNLTDFEGKKICQKCVFKISSM